MSEEGTQAPAEGDATLTEEQIDRFIPERIGVRNWGKPEQADLFNRGQVRDAIRAAIASQPNVQLKAAEVGAAPWSKTVESAALLLQRCTGLELQDCENLAGTILGMAANVQTKGTVPKLDDIEQYRMQMAGISTAALGYWKEGDNINPDYDTVALRDVAKLYAKYDALYKAAQAPAVGDALPPLPKVGPIGFASVVGVESYALWLKIGPHLPGVRDVALWTTDQMRAYARAALANVQPKGTELTPDEIQALWSPYAGAAPFAFARKIEAAIAAKGSPTQAPRSRD